jgi:hypothetical protein
MPFSKLIRAAPQTHSISRKTDFPAAEMGLEGKRLWGYIPAMIAEEKVVSLGNLHDEVLELKKAVVELDRASTSASEPSISFEDASEHVRSNYSHLLQKLSQ